MIFVKLWGLQTKLLLTMYKNVLDTKNIGPRKSGLISHDFDDK